MKTILKYIFLLSTLLGGFITSCVDETDQNETDSHSLMLTYEVIGADVSTRVAVGANSDENKIGFLYSLFFNDNNEYIGHTYAEVNSSESGSINIKVPKNEDIYQPWELIFIANLEYYVGSTGHTPSEMVEDATLWLDNTLSGKTLSEAQTLLKVAVTTKGILPTDPQLMTATASKGANKNIISAKLTRKTARVDVSNSSGTFKIETVEIQNAARHSYLMDGPINDEYINYNAVSASDQKVNNQYIFGNHVEKPSDTPAKTTCVIVGGKYLSSPTTTYHRINIAYPDKEQYIMPNHIYTIDITNIKGAGTTQKAEATDADVSYTFNTWNNSLNTDDYVFDANGNGLYVSQKQIIFNEKKNQEVTINVSMLNNSTTSVNTAAYTAILKGTHAANFKLTKANNYFRITTSDDNETGTNRVAEAVITYGGSEVVVSITQLSSGTVNAGIQINPISVTFDKPGGNEEITVTLSGINEGGELLDPVITWQGDFINWFELNLVSHSGNTYKYKISATPMNDAYDNFRTGNITFQVKEKSSISSATFDVIQTYETNKTYDSPLYNIYILENEYNWGDGNFHNYYNNIGKPGERLKGLPTGRDVATTLQFPALHPTYLKYSIEFSSEAVNANVSLTSGDSYFTLTKENNSRWTLTMKSAMGLLDATRTGKLTVSENGNASIYNIYQDGTLGRIKEHVGRGSDSRATYDFDGNMYYYNFIPIQNGKNETEVWLDRPLGAKTTGHFSNNSNCEKENVEEAKGLYFLLEQAKIQCPPGFRLPEYGDSLDEEVAHFMKYVRYTSGTSGIAQGVLDGVTEKLVYYLKDKNDKIHFLQSQGLHRNYTTATSGYDRGDYVTWIKNTNDNTLSSFMQLSSNDNRTIYNSTAYSGIVRCIYSERLP